MTKYLHLLIFVGITQFVFSQNYKPTTTWPFLYENFKNGKVYFSDMSKTKEQTLNIHLQHSTLYHIDGENILQSNPKDIIKVIIGDDSFIYMNGELVRLIKGENNKMALVKSVKADYKSLIKNEGAYGMSSEAASSQKMNALTNINFTMAKIEKSEGQTLPLDTKYYFIINEKIIQATQKEFEKGLTDDGKKQLREYTKKNKIKWKDEEGLIKIYDYLNK